MNETTLAELILISLLRRWMWLLLGGFVAAAVSALIILQQPVAYQATIDVVPRLHIFSLETASSTTAGDAHLIPLDRRQALAGLVPSNSIEHIVQSELGDQLPPVLRQPGELVKLVTAVPSVHAEAITIAVSAPRADLAEAIDLAWARAYQRYVRDVYSSTEPVNLSAAQDQAKQRYRAAEDALTQFVATSHRGEYDRQLGATLLQLSVRQRLDLLLGDAQALERQLAGARDNSAAASSAVALTLLKTEAFASSMSLVNNAPAGSSPSAPSAQQGQNGVSGPPSGSDTSQQGQWQLPTGLQLQLSGSATPPSLDQQRADVAALVAALQERRAGLVPEGDAAQSTSPQMEADIRSLQGRVADLAARQRALELERDIAWTTYTTMAKKAQEAEIASATATRAEILVIEDSVSAKRLGRGLLRVPMLAGIIGVLLAAGVVALIDLIAPLHRRITAGAAAPLSGGLSANGSPPATESAGIGAAVR